MSTKTMRTDDEILEAARKSQNFIAMNLLQVEVLLDLRALAFAAAERDEERMAILRKDEESREAFRALSPRLNGILEMAETFLQTGASILPFPIQSFRAVPVVDGEFVDGVQPAPPGTETKRSDESGEA